ncbi:MAG: methionine biosynthesis protein MetW [Frankiaceae bacterium]
METGIDVKAPVSEVPPLALYGAALAAFSAGHRRPGWLIRDADGRVCPLDLRRWCSARTAGDDGLLNRCDGPTLDIGCGPGRLLAGLAARNIPALGIDVASAAVRLAAARGAVVLHRSVFDSLPGTGGWSHALLADGNLGIGGNPLCLLRRVGELLAADGSLLCELDPPGTTAGPVRLRIESPLGQTSAWFPWARTPADEFAPLAAAAGLRCVEQWRDGPRWFASVGTR